LTEAELEKLNAYMEQGGRLFLIQDYVAEDLPNLKSLVASYGLSIKEGIVLEGDSGYYIQQNYYMVPDYVNHSITKPMIDSAIRCLAITAQAVEETEENQESGEAEISWLLQTSEKAFNKAEIVDSSSLVQQDSDPVASYYLGAVSQKGSGENASALAVLTTSSFIDEDVNTYIAGGNYDLVINIIGFLCDHEEAITIHTKNLDTEYIAISANQVVIWSIVLVIALPVLLLAAGIIIWAVRRRR
jgi:ABC-2 type transport system permease protein